jgi:hypothetical protein
MQKKNRIIAIILLLINGIGALWGGAGLIYDPTGEFLQMPLELIKHAPFVSYLIPGIILFVFNGLLSIFTAIATARKIHFHPVLILLQGIVLAIWLITQIIMIRLFYPPLHLPFLLIAGILIMIGFFLRKMTKE